VGYSLSFALDYTLMRFRTSGSHGAVARLREVNSREQAREMKEYGLFVDEDDIRSKNEKIIFDDEMIGSVVTDIVSGEPIGKIIDTMELPANDIWIVDTPRGELPLPVTDEVIIENDSENERVAVRLPEGIWELAKGGDNE
jgi:ribosomal 30S subunit maturation factor RimM